MRDRVRRRRFFAYLLNLSCISLAKAVGFYRVGDGETSFVEVRRCKVHAGNGTIDEEAATEVAAFECARRFLSYLPSSVHELPELA